jgi:hypothetical protein
MTMDDTIKFPYAPPRELAAGLWVLDGRWSNALGRRMTVLRLRTNEVWVHNPMRLHPQDLAWLSSLGTVKGLIAPNKWHTSDLLWMAAKFAQAQVICPPSFIEKSPQIQERLLFTTDVSYLTPCRELEFFAVPGVRFEETAVYHPFTRTLILCDLMMNLPLPANALKRSVYRFNNMGDCCAPTRVLKWFMTHDAKELLAFVEQLAQLNPKRIVVNHGAVFEGEAGSQIRTAFASLFR